MPLLPGHERLQGLIRRRHRQVPAAEHPERIDAELADAVHFLFGLVAHVEGADVADHFGGHFD